MERLSRSISLFPNGEVVWFLDIRNSQNIRRQISNFHTSDALEEFFLSDIAADYEWFTNNPINSINRLRNYQERAMSGEAREQFANFIPDGDMVKFASELPERVRRDFTATMKLLRDKSFQDLLLNYQRAKRSFMVGYEVEDNVSSEIMIRIGKDYQKPEDYLDSFFTFVKENPEQIEAIRILLERPKEWKTDALNKLRNKLTRNDFSEDKLQKAHKLVYNKALADII